MGVRRASSKVLSFPHKMWESQILGTPFVTTLEDFWLANEPSILEHKQIANL